MQMCWGLACSQIPRKMFLGPLERLVRLHGGNIEFQSRDFPHCYVSLKELLTHTHRLTVTVEKLRTLELWTHLQASLDFSLESTGLKLRLLVRVLPPPAV